MMNLDVQNRAVADLVKKLEELLHLLCKEEAIQKKLTILDKYSKNDLPPFFTDYFKKCSVEETYIIKSIQAIGQSHVLFGRLSSDDLSSHTWKKFIDVLVDIQHFYESLGGIIGYHLMVLKLILERQNNRTETPENVSFHHPLGVDIEKDTVSVRHVIRWGIESLPLLAEIYPVGGAGDRLDLHDEKTGEALPAAELKFCGRTLLEGLLRDLQGREYLYFKFFGKQISTPIAMMTSHEKNNHAHILKICEEHFWFGRNKDCFQFFTQPLVPVVTIQGEWIVLDKLHLMLKPGGHGVIWKLANDLGVIDSLSAKGRKFALIRQINNPISGTDYGLCALYGWGIHRRKVFGFASCPRLLNTAEGMNILIEKKLEDGSYEYHITNLEYTEFEHYGIHDLPEKPGSSYSKFPANTNILFVELETIKDVLKNHFPIPGMLINMKNKIKHVNSQGIEEMVAAGRLESTMQNIADYIVDHYPNKLNPLTEESLRTFVTYNERRKTISVAKKAYVPGKTIVETPEGCFFELLQNYEELLRNFCKMDLPHLGTVEKYLEKGPPFIFLFHPALGPFYSIIGQKIQGGVLQEGAELQLEIAEIEIKNINLQGSFIIDADCVCGKQEKEEISYCNNVGRCILKDVTIKNKGMDFEASKPHWRNQFVRKEEMRVILHGHSEFVAENVTFEGSQRYEVPDGHRLTISANHQKRLEKIDSPSWTWSYRFDQEDRIILNKLDSNG